MDEKKDIIQKNWHKTLRQLQNPDGRWMKVKGPMAATICTLLDMKWKPIHPCKWMPHDSEEIEDFSGVEGVTNHKVKHLAEKHLTDSIWKEAADDNDNGGYEKGKPDLTAASRAYDFFTKKEMHEEAKALQTVILNKSWTAERVQRSGMAQEGSAPND